MKCTCKDFCKNLEGYQRGYFHFAQEGKRWCGNCNYKIKTEERVCPCCKGSYRVVPNNNRSRQQRKRKIKQELATIPI